jgi:hypothetical protein
VSRTRNWCKLHERWYEDEVLSVIADEHPIVMALWPVLVARCYAASHVDDNPLGTIRTSVKQLAGFVRSTPDEVSMALQKLVEGEFLEAREGLLGTCELQLAAFTKHQQPKGSPAQRTQQWRAGKYRHNVTEASHERDVSVTQKRREGEERREDSPKEGGRVHAGTTPPNEELAVCLQAVARFATPAELDSWTEQLALHRAANPGAPIECYTNAALKVAAYATEQHSSRLAFGKAWGRFQRDFAWARRDAHDARPPVADAAASSGMAPASIRKLVGLDPA